MPTSETTRDAVQACLTTARACIELVPYCLTRGGVRADRVHLDMLMNCAEMCQKAANMMLRSDFGHHEVRENAAKACDVCAEYCDIVGPNDDEIKACRDQAVRCAQACREVKEAPARPTRVVVPAPASTHAFPARVRAADADDDEDAA